MRRPRFILATATAPALLTATAGWAVLPAQAGIALNGARLMRRPRFILATAAALALLAATAGWTVLPAQAGITFRTLE